MRRTAVSLALAGVLALGACGGEASPKPAPYTRTPTPSMVAPTLGPDSRGESRSAAAAVIRYYFSSFSYAGATGDTSPLRDVSTSNCEGCRATIDMVEKVHAAGGTFVGDGYTAERVDFRQTGSADRLVASVRLKIAPLRLTMSKGASPSSYPGGVNDATVTVALVDGSWKLAEVLR